MTETSATLIPETATKTKNSQVASERKKYALTFREAKWPLLFLLSLSMMGLDFPPGYLLVFLIMVRTFRTDRYQFVMMLLMLGGYGFLDNNIQDVVLACAIIGLVIYRQPPKLRRITIAYFIFCLLVIFLAAFSEERMAVQFRLMRNFFMFAFFILPIISFSGKKFEPDKFFKTLLDFVFIISIFFLIDVFIFKGRVLIPNTAAWGDPSRFWDLDINILSTEIPRKTCHGMLLGVLAVYPMVKTYKTGLWFNIVFWLAVLCTRTFLFIVPLFVTYTLLKGKIKIIVPYLLGALVVGGILYMLDSDPPQPGYDSPLRIRSALNQFEALGKIEDDEDMANFGSGRMAQLIPKFEYLSENHKELTGIGFLHPEYTTKAKFIIYNPFYADVEVRDEVVCQTEIFVANVILSIGYIGLALILIFYFLIYFFIRKWPLSNFYLSTMLCVFFISFGGIATWGERFGLFMMGMCVAVSWLTMSNTENKKRSFFKQRKSGI